MVFEVWKTLLSDQSEVFGIYCNGEEIYGASSEDDAHTRCLALHTALSTNPAATVSPCPPDEVAPLGREINKLPYRPALGDTKSTENEEFNAAINFAIDTGGSDGINFLRYWREGSFDVIARAYPEFSGPIPTNQLQSAETSESA